MGTLPLRCARAWCVSRLSRLSTPGSRGPRGADPRAARHAILPISGWRCAEMIYNFHHCVTTHSRSTHNSYCRA